MFDDLFTFIDPVIDTELFMAQVEDFFDSHEQFSSGYQRLSMANPISDKQKNLDLAIGLALIGQKGREQIAERVRLLQEKRMSQ